jgi:hypothetical protein
MNALNVRAYCEGVADRAAELAFVEAQREISAQQSTIDSVHGRTANVFTVAGIGTGFIGPMALDRHEGLPGTAWLSIVLLTISLGASIYIWWPRSWIWTNDAKVLAGPDWADRDVDYVHRQLAVYTGNHVATNQPGITKVLWAFQVAMVTSALSVGSWILVLVTGDAPTP